MIDFHTHILPNMDDGSKSVLESFQMLEELEKQSVKLVCLTPHFYYWKESVDEFISRRDNAYKSLNYSGDLKLLLGAEVRYYRGISQSNDLDRLCLQNNRLLLIELPFDMNINDNVIKELIDINSKGFGVVLAHIERYGLSIDTIRYLKSSGLKIQANNEYIIGSFLHHEGIKMLKDGYIDFLGSDAHDLNDRRPNFDELYIQVNKRISSDFISVFETNNDKMITSE